MSIIKKFLTSKADPGIKYYHFFWDKGDHCLGYRFPCDSEGKLLRNEHYDSWIQNYKKCISRPEDFDAGIQVERIIETYPHFVQLWKKLFLMETSGVAADSGITERIRTAY